MAEDLRQLTDEINRRPDEIEQIQDVTDWFDAHMEACAAASSALEARTDAELIEVIGAQSAERPDLLRYDPRDSPAARAAAAVLSLRYYRRAQRADTVEILEELAPLTDYRDPVAAVYRPEDYREEITAPDALRREALVSVLIDRYDAALSAAEKQAEATPWRDQAAAVCQASERQVTT